MIASVALLALVAVAPQDLTLRGVRVTTGDAKATWSSSVVSAERGRVLPEGEVVADGAVERDLRGFGYVVPGLVDAHAHLLGLGQALEQVDLTGCKSYAELVERVRMHAESVQPGEWIVGRGWDQNDWPDTRLPTHDELSSHVPDHPVVLTRVDGHALLANFAALEIAGIDASTESPSGGEVLFEDGLPTGVLVDRAMDLVRGHIPKHTREQIARYLMAAQAECVRLGLTGVHDAGMAPEVLDVLRELHTRGRWGLRVYVMLPASAEAEIRRGPWQTPDRVITVRAVKAYADGALGSRGAALLEPYADRPGSRGLMLTPRKELTRIGQLCADHGFQLCVHAIGDKANRVVLDAMQAVAFADSARAARFRIEHAQIVHPDDVGRFVSQHVIPSMQPTHLTSDMPWAGARLGSERIDRAYNWRRFLGAGLAVPFGSDFPVEAPDPRLGFYAAATTRSADGGEPEWRPEQKLEREAILRGFTAHAAYASFGEHDFGTIEAGKFADFTVFDRDILTCDADELQEARVLMTVIGGRIVWEVPSPSPEAERISATRMRELVTELAGDPATGRGTPSAGLDRAAQFIESQLGRVGLVEGGDGGSYYHRYEQDAAIADWRGTSLRVVRDGAAPLELAAGRDVRVWRPGRPLVERELRVEFEPMRRLGYARGKNPVVLLCPEDSPVWRVAAEPRPTLRRVVPGSAPVLLVREGAVPPGAADVVVTVPEAREATIELPNLVAVYRGTDRAAEYVVVCAHFDHLGVHPTAGPDAIFNGADDNATGAAAVVALAQWLAESDVQTRRSIAFVCFSGEERGLLGSRAFVERPPFPLIAVHSVINLEMLGRPAAGKRNYAWITGPEFSDFVDRVRPAFARRGVDLIDFALADRLFFASDNLPFAQKGVVAHSISAGELHADYHKPTDEPDRIDYGHMARVVEAVRELMLDCANEDGRPAFSEKGKRAIER